MQLLSLPCLLVPSNCRGPTPLSPFPALAICARIDWCTLQLMILYAAIQFKCLIIRHRHHDDVDSRHPKYTVSSAPISTGGPFLTSFPHSHGNRSVHLSLTRHTTSVSSPFLHFTSGPVHCLLSATPCHPFTCVLNCTRSCVVWLVDSGWRLSLLPPSQ
jgi:hypothetical protein